MRRAISLCLTGVVSVARVRYLRVGGIALAFSSCLGGMVRLGKGSRFVSERVHNSFITVSLQSFQDDSEQFKMVGCSHKVT
jgi:hypothetical protein